MNSVGAAKPTTKSTLYALESKKENCICILSNAPIVEESIRWTQ